MIQVGEIFAVYKPKGMTSHDVVAIIRKATGVKRGGHAGTLDPLAKGVLVIGVGRSATKRLKDIVGQQKQYLALIKLGYTSATDDAEGLKTKIIFKSRPTLVEVKKAVAGFVGNLKQTPPPYSAINIGGKKAYRLGRAGQAVQTQPRLLLVVS